MYNFDLIIFLDLGGRVFGLGNDLFVQGHGKVWSLNIQLTGQVLKVLAFQNFTVFAINGQFQKNRSKKTGKV